MKKRNIIIYLSILCLLTTSINMVKKNSAEAKTALATKEASISMLIKNFTNDNFTKPTKADNKHFKDWKKIKKVNRKHVGSALANKIIPKTKRFKPKAKIKRKVFAAWVVKVIKKAKLNIPVSNNGKLPYNDVKNKKDKSNITYLYKRNIMQGLKKKKFGVNKSLTKSALKQVRKDIKKAMNSMSTLEPTVDPTLGFTPSPSPTASPIPTPTFTPGPPTPTPGPPTPTPFTYENLIGDNWEFEKRENLRDERGEYEAPRGFTASNTRFASVKTDLGVFMKGLLISEGGTTKSKNQIPSSYSGKEVQITCLAKMNSSNAGSAEMRIRVNGYSKSGSNIKAPDANSLIIDSASFNNITQNWIPVYKKVVLPEVDSHFEVEISCSSGSFTIDDLEVLPLENQEEAIYSFDFLKSDNPGLNADIHGRIKQSTGEIIVKLPEGYDVSNLKASFASSGGTVKVNEVTQESGKTANNFNRVLRYIIVGKGEEREYRVHAYAFDTGIPSIMVNTVNSRLITSRDNYINGTIAVVGPNAEYFPMDEEEMKIRGRGNSSWGMDKKSYRFKTNEKTSVLGMPANRDWVLIANHGDKSLMRNYLAYTIAAGMDWMDYAPRIKFVNMFYNGRYHGLYTVGDHIEEAKNRVNVEVTDGTDTGFILEANVRINTDWYNPKPVEPFIYVKSPTYMTSTSGNMQNIYLEFTDPSHDELTPAQMNAIASYINSADKAILTRNPAEYNKWIDYKSFTDWFLVEELFKNLDSGMFSSCFMHKDVGGKLKMGPVWDFDSSAGNHDSSWFTQTNEWVGSGSYWIGNTVLQGQGLTRLKSRYRDVKEDKIDIIFDLIDETAELIRPSYEENFDLWKIQGVAMWPNPPVIVAATTLDEHVGLMKDWFKKRIAWMDSQLLR